MPQSAKLLFIGFFFFNLYTTINSPKWIATGPYCHAAAMAVQTLFIVWGVSEYVADRIKK